MCCICIDSFFLQEMLKDKGSFESDFINDLEIFNVITNPI